METSKNASLKSEILLLWPKAKWLCMSQLSSSPKLLLTFEYREEFLKHVRENWTLYSVELVNYQNKCRLIKGWDDIFAKCTDHLNSLTSMKHSPYYKVFEDDGKSFNQILETVNRLLFISSFLGGQVESHPCFV
jgi:hypothetical protein